MITADEIKLKFIEDFKALIQKYDADLEIEDHFSGYAECGRNMRLDIDFPSKYDKDGNMIQQGGNLSFNNSDLFCLRKR